MQENNLSHHYWEKSLSRINTIQAHLVIKMQLNSETDWGGPLFLFSDLKINPGSHVRMCSTFVLCMLLTQNLCGCTSPPISVAIAGGLGGQ